MVRNSFRWVLLIAFVVVLSACGGGGGQDTSGTLAVDTSSATVAPGTPIAVSATYANSNAAHVQNVEVQFSTNHPELFPSIKAYTNSAGVATALLAPVNGSLTPVTVAVTATTGNLVAVTNVTLQPNTLTVTPPTNGTFSAPATAAGAMVTFVPSGVFAVVKDGNGNPIANWPVTISVSTIVNQMPGEGVTLWDNYPVTTATPPTTQTIVTDTTGKVPVQVSTDMIAPGPGGSNVMTVVWKVTTTDPATGGTLVGYGSTLYTVTTAAT